MLRIDSIQLTHFKNYQVRRFEFDHVVGICGPNGIGKTNLLDAIYYSCFTRSYFSPSEQMNTLFNEDGFRLEARFELMEKPSEVVSIYRGKSKEVMMNGIPYEKLSQHIGVLPVVIIAPDDIELITGAGEKRRRFIDTLLSQADAIYLENLIGYNKILQQRNSLLRKEETGNKHELLDVLDRQLAVTGKVIFEKRKTFMEAFAPMVRNFYKMIAGPGENVEVSYRSELLSGEFAPLLAKSREKDMVMQRSMCGIHRDDIELELNGEAFRHIASQGQRKSMLFAMKLAEYESLRERKGFPPIMLLDDVFEKLDDRRMMNLLHWVCRENKGQVFITDTHRARLEETFATLGINGQVIELN